MRRSLVVLRGVGGLLLFAAWMAFVLTFILGYWSCSPRWQEK